MSLNSARVWLTPEVYIPEPEPDPEPEPEPEPKLDPEPEPDSEPETEPEIEDQYRQSTYVIPQVLQYRDQVTRKTGHGL